MADFNALLTDIRRSILKSRSGFPPLSPAEMDALSYELGFPVPELVRQLYRDVANGGFGPGYGLLRFDEIVQTYRELHDSREQRDEIWQDGLIPFVDWGCMIFSCLDTQNAMDGDPIVVRYEPNMTETQTRELLHGSIYRGKGLLVECLALSQWLEKWLHPKASSN